MQFLGRLWNWLKWPAALAVLAALVAQRRTELAAFADQPKDWRLLGAAFVLCAGATSLTFVRWHLLVRALDFPFRLRDAFRLGCLGLLLNYVGVGLVGGDVFKAVFIAREQQSRRGVAAATVLLDRILGLLSLLQLGALASLGLRGFPESNLHTAVFWSLWIGSAVGLAGVLLLLSPAVTRSLRRLPLERIPLVGKLSASLLEGITLYQSRPQALFIALLMGIVSHFGFFTGFYCCALSLRSWAPDLITHLYIMPAAAVIGVLSPTPGGIGALEWAIQQAYVSAAPAHIPTAEADAAALFAGLASRLINVLLAVLGGLYSLPARKELRQSGLAGDDSESAERDEPAACAAQS